MDQANAYGQAGADVVDFMMSEHAATGNALWLAEAFVQSVKHGDGQPPAALLHWLADALEAWLASEGKGDIGALLGLKVRGASVFEQFDNALRDLVLVRDMDVLMYLGASREDAAHIASDKRTGIDGQPWRGVLSADTLLAKHSRARSAGLASSDYIAAMTATPAQVSQFLAQFGQHYMNKRLKSMI